MPHLVVPDPSLVVLVGPAGTGKSTFAAVQFAPDEILSSDAFRARVGRDEADQGATSRAFALLHRELERRLGARLLTVVDATNVEGRARHALLRQANAARLPAVAIVFDLPPGLVLARNAARATRVVDAAVVKMHLSLLRTAIDQGRLENEGFERVYRLRQPREVDAAIIVRTG
ncbi:MAG: AAA family ATPase [Chloroflexota bacterium]|nr:AAA family ATPase [Chloroflexota bacterium]